MKTKNFDSAMEECPRFSFCNINSCPLALKKYKNHPTDWSAIHKEKCVSKARRKRIGKKWGLKNGGMTQGEISATRKWDNLPEKEKQRRIAILKKSSPIIQRFKLKQENTHKNYFKSGEHIQKRKNGFITHKKGDI